MSLTDKARITGSILVILAYYLILNVDKTVGASIGLIGDSISIPYFIQNRAFDVVILLSMLIMISLHSILL